MKNYPKKVQSYKMNERDQRNLDFLLKVDHQTLMEWYNTASVDDLLYAQELFQAKTTELIIQELELLDCIYDIRYAKVAFDLINKIRSKTEHQLHVFTFLENYSLAKNTDSYWNDFRQDYANNTSEYIEFEKSLNDHQSTLIWNHLKNLRLFGDFMNIDKFPKSNGKHYFPEFLEFEELGEVFYDIGCFDGETALNFVDECPTFKKIYEGMPD